MHANGSVPKVGWISAQKRVWASLASYPTLWLPWEDWFAALLAEHAGKSPVVLDPYRLVYDNSPCRVILE